MQVQDQIVHKSALAKLLATEDITVRINPRAKTASFDVVNRVLYLPLWQNISDELYDMLLIHEVGHGLDTPADGWITAVPAIAMGGLGKKGGRAEATAMHFLNVVEDVRIDRRQMRRYPGCRRDYVVGYEELRHRNFFGTKGKDLNEYGFIDRFNMYFKGGRALGIHFSADERIYLKEADTVETWDDVVAFATRLLAFCKAELDAEEKKAKEKAEAAKKDAEKQAKKDAKEKEKSEAAGDADAEEETEEAQEDSESDEAQDGAEETDGSEETEEAQETADEDTEAEEATTSAPGEGDKDEEGDAVVDPSDENSDEPAEDEAESAMTDGNGLEGGKGTGENECLPESQTEKAWQENADALVSNTKNEIVYVELPKLNYKNVVVDYKTVMKEIAESRRIKGNPAEQTWWMEAVQKSFQTWKMTERDSISYMVKEFDMRKAADEYHRTSTARTGRLDMNQLHAYKVSDNLFLQEEVVADGQSHGFVMIIDWSSSMIKNLAKTVKQLLTLTLFCKQTQIPFEVYSFRDTRSSDNGGSWEYLPNDPSLEFSEFRMRNLLSSRMTSNELNQAMLNMWILGHFPGTIGSEPMSSTPLDGAIMATSTIVNDFKKRTGVQVVNTIILTDGDSNPISMVNYKPPTFFSPSAVTKFYVTDPETKKTYSWDNKRAEGKEHTNMFLKMLKERTGCNLVGFFIYEPFFRRPPEDYKKGKLTSSILNEFRWIFARNATVEELKVMTDSWKDHAFLEAKSSGYDTYFVLDALRMGSGTNIQMGKASREVITVKEAVKQMMEENRIKIRSRIILKKFISLITT